MHRQVCAPLSCRSGCWRTAPSSKAAGDAHARALQGGWDILPEDGASPNDFPNSYRKIFWRPDDDTPTLKDVYDGKLTLVGRGDHGRADGLAEWFTGAGRSAEPRQVGNTLGWGQPAQAGHSQRHDGGRPCGSAYLAECGVNLPRRSPAPPCCAARGIRSCCMGVGKAAALEVHENGIGTSGWLPAINTFTAAPV